MGTPIRIILHIVLFFTPCIILLLVPFRNRLKFSFEGTCLVAFGLIALSIVTTCIFYSSGNLFSVWQIPQMLFYLLLCCGLCFTMVKGAKMQLLFTLFLLECYADIIQMNSKILQYYLAPQSLDELLPNAYLLGETAMVVLFFPLMWLFVTKLLLPVIDCTEDSPFWRYLWLIPASFYLIYRVGIYPEYLSFSSLVHKGLFFLPIAWSLGTFLSYFIILLLIRETSERAQLQEALHRADTLVMAQQEQYVLIQQNIASAKQARHDLRHHLLAVTGYLEKQDEAGLRQYLQDYLSQLDASALVSYCDNTAVNALLQHYISLAEQAGGAVKAAVELPEELPVGEADFCVVLGNLLENAVEACLRQKERQPFIDLKVQLVSKKMVAISVKNSFDHPIRCQQNRFFSSKRAEEGLGLASVRRVVEKHQGVMQISYEDQVFSVSVLLNP